MKKQPQDIAKLNRDLIRSLNEFKGLKEIALEVFSAADLKVVAENIMVFFNNLWNCTGCKFFAQPRSEPFYAAGAEFNCDDSLIAWSFENDKPAIIPYGEDSSLLYLPLVIQNTRLGMVVFLFGKRAEDFDSNFIEIVTIISFYISSFLLNKMHLDEAKRTSEYLANIFESLPNGVITLDKEMKVQFINRNASFLLDVTEPCLGEQIEGVLPSNIRGIVMRYVNTVIKEGYAEELVASRMSQLGIELSFAVSCNILRKGADTSGLILIFRDLTASKELERLRELDRLKDAFVSNVSHELKTPLTSIRAYTEALQDMAQDDTQKEFLKVVIEESDRLLNLINELLSVQRIQSGRIKVNYQVFNLTELINEVIRLLAKQSDKHQLIFELKDEVKISADYNLVKEVVINLAGNAIKYSPAGGRIWISVDVREDNNAVISVKDEGIGIPKEAQGKLFQPFYRVDSSLTNTIAGTGLGLSIVKSIVEAHLGKVDFESEAGKGTTFFVTLPMEKI